MAAAAAITVFAGGVELLFSRASGSLFLLADAVHLLAHLGIFLVLLIPPGRLHGASEDLSAVTVLVIVVGIAGWVLWISVDHLLHPPDVVPNPLAMLASIFGLAANTCSALLFRKPAATHFSFRAALAHELSDGGMTLAGLAGAGCIALFGWRWVDPPCRWPSAAGWGSGRCGYSCAGFGEGPRSSTSTRSTRQAARSRPGP